MEVENIWKTQGEGKLFVSHDTNHSSGVMALVRSNLGFKLKSINVDNEGRYLIIEAEVQSSAYLLVNIYARNKVQIQCRFFSKCKHVYLVVEKEHKIFIGGDFNITLDSDLDCSGGNPSKKDSTKNISDLCSDLDIVDIWTNPKTKRITWRQKNPLIQGRLDYWLISNACQEEIETTSEYPATSLTYVGVL